MLARGYDLDTAGKMQRRYKHTSNTQLDEDQEGEQLRRQSKSVHRRQATILRKCQAVPAVHAARLDHRNYAST